MVNESMQSIFPAVFIPNALLSADENRGPRDG